jgi:hypothetical protein
VTLESPAGGDVASRTVAVSIDVAEMPADGQHPQGSGAQDVRCSATARWSRCGTETC